jgi:hypothetical protein
VIINIEAVPLGVTSADELDWNSEYTRRPSSPRTSASQ